MKLELMPARKLLFSCLLLFSVSQVDATPPPRYTVRDLGILSGFRSSSANAVNNRGWVTGAILARDGTTRAYLYHEGILTNLGGLGSPAHRAKGHGISSVGNAINDQGDVTGWAYVDDEVTHAFLYHHGKMRDLGKLNFIIEGTLDEWVGSSGNAINNSGEIAGVSSDADAYGRAFLYTRGHMTNLGMPPGEDSDASSNFQFTVLKQTGLNDRGEMVIIVDGPYHSHEANKSRLYLYKYGKFHRIATLSDPANFLSVLLNNRGVVAGTYYDKNERVCGFHLHRSRVEKIGSLLHSYQTDVRAINNLGQIIGSSDYHAGKSHAFLYSQGKMTDLNNRIHAGSGWVLESANGINDKGQIVGTGIHNGKTRAFMLTPLNY